VGFTLLQVLGVTNDGELAHWALDGSGLVLKSILDAARDIEAGRLEVVLQGIALPSSPIHAVYPHSGMPRQRFAVASRSLRSSSRYLVVLWRPISCRKLGGSAWSHDLHERRRHRVPVRSQPFSINGDRQARFRLPGVSEHICTCLRSSWKWAVISASVREAVANSGLSVFRDKASNSDACVVASGVTFGRGELVVWSRCSSGVARPAAPTRIGSCRWPMPGPRSRHGDGATTRAVLPYTCGGRRPGARPGGGPEGCRMKPGDSLFGRTKNWGTVTLCRKAAVLLTASNPRSQQR
jgi:hypothetical protein